MFIVCIVYIDTASVQSFLFSLSLSFLGRAPALHPPSLHALLHVSLDCKPKEQHRQQRSDGKSNNNSDDDGDDGISGSAARAAAAVPVLPCLQAPIFLE